MIIRPETNTAAKLSLSSISWSGRTLQGLLNWRRCSLTKYLPPLWCVVGIFPKPLLPRQGECYKTVPHSFYWCCKSDEAVKDCPIKWWDWGDQSQNHFLVHNMLHLRLSNPITWPDVRLRWWNSCSNTISARQSILYELLISAVHGPLAE